MKKILSFFAFVAIVISFAACGGNEPELAKLQLKAQALTTEAYFVITPPANNQHEYFFCWARKSKVEQIGTVQDYVEYDLNGWAYDNLKKYKLIQTDKTEFYTADEGYTFEGNITYVLYACYIVKEGNKAKIAGDVEYVEFTTSPDYTLNGVFAVDNQGKKVRFSQANLRNKNGSYHFFDNQWDYTGSYTNYPLDLFNWDKITYCPTGTSVLSRDEWWYVLKERPNAEKLFAHATVNGVHGLILLPDNWETPDGIELTTSYQMGIVWNSDENRYAHKNNQFDGYGQNVYDATQWRILEFAGAVFMPSTWAGNAAGWYWTSTASGDKAYEFSYGTYTLNLTYLLTANTKNDNASIRSVDVVE